jgi:hypothetical protein
LVIGRTLRLIHESFVNKPGYWAEQPPSTTRSVAVIPRLSGESKKAAACATSSGLPNPSGCESSKCRICSAVNREKAFSVISVRTMPGESTFTRVLTQVKLKDPAIIGRCLPGGLFQPFAIPADQHQARALASKTNRHGPSDPGGSAGHNDCLPPKDHIPCIAHADSSL